ncbi:hypothetical protein CK220_31185 [Mesorhizobium sp. WSM3860]|nr:hypothetical protein CK220_31185 [Mesorhizobium sp. WSM3860]
MIGLAKPDIPRVLSNFKVISYKAVVSHFCDTTYSICHMHLISLFAFYKLHNSYVNRSFLGGTNVRHFRSFRLSIHG